MAETVAGCIKCNRLACVCDVRAAHPNPRCAYLIAVTCAVPIECEHGYDACPECDPCTCASPAPPATERP